MFFQRLKILDINLANLKNKQWITIGEQTRAKINKEFFCSLMPTIQNTAGLIKFLASMHLKNKIFWFPCSNLTGVELKEFLAKKEAKLMQQTIYYNRLPEKSEAQILISIIAGSAQLGFLNQWIGSEPKNSKIWLNTPCGA